MNKKIVLGAIGFLFSEVMPFFPQFKGNGITHSIVDFLIVNNDLIERVTNVDVNKNSIIGKHKNTCHLLPFLNQEDKISSVNTKIKKNKLIIEIDLK